MQQSTVFFRMLVAEHGGAGVMSMDSSAVRALSGNSMISLDTMRTFPGPLNAEFIAFIYFYVFICFSSLSASNFTK